MAASSAIMDLTDDYLISANVNMSSLKFVIDRLIRGVNGPSD